MNRLLYYLVVGGGIIFMFAIAPSNVNAATNVTSCGVLDQANEIYTLTQNVSSSGTCFAISADNVTLDLNGYTVTYGTSGGDNYFGIAMPPGYANDFSRARFPGLPDSAFGGGSHATIYGGTINQYTGGGSNGHSIYGRLYTEVYGVTSTVYGDDTDNFFFEWASNLKIHDNTLYSNSTVVTNRHQGKGVIESLRDGGNTKIYNNTIIGGPQWGIRISHNSGGETGFEIYGNTISHNAYVSNPYGIGAHADNTLVYDNVITPSNGRGIHVTRNNIKVYNNTVTVKEGPNAEYAGGWSHGIKVEGATNSKVYGNTVTALGGGGYGSAYALDVSVNAGSNNEIYNNVFTATTSSSSYLAAAAHLLDIDANSGLDIHNNTFRSNNYNVLVDWDNAHDVLFRSNTFETTGSLINYSTVRFNNGVGISTGIIFLDSVLGSGTTVTSPSVRGSSPGFSYSVEQYINVVAKDNAGNAVANATITVKDKNGVTQVSGKTNSSGIFLTRATVNSLSGSPVAKTTVTPHTVSIAASGYDGDTHTVTLSSSKTVNFTLQSGTSTSSDTTYTAPNNYTPPSSKVTKYRAPISSSFNKLITAPQFGGGPIVRIFGPDYKLKKQFLAYDGSFRGGIHAVSADLEGDGIEEIVTVPIGNAGPHVKVFDANGVELSSKFVTTQGYRSGFQIAVGDVDGDGKDEIVLGANKGGGPQVIVYEFVNNELRFKKAFFAYAEFLRMGIQISLGDVDGDNVQEIIVAPNKGGGPHIRVFEWNGKVIGSFFAYGEGVRTGVSISIGDVNKDGRDEIVTVPGRGSPANVAVWTYKGKMLSGFYALPPTLKMGVTARVGDIDADGEVEIITTPLRGGGPQVSIFDWHGNIKQRWFAYAPWNRAGLTAEVFDIDNDNQLEIVTIPLRGQGPHVKVFDAKGYQYKEFFSHGLGGFRGGVEIAGPSK